MDPHPEHPIVLPAIAWLPVPQQVADILRARTKDDQSSEIGAWTANTRPTEYEVYGLIQTAASDTLAAVNLLHPDYEDPDGAACSLCTYRAAMLIELSYWPEQAAAFRGGSQSAFSEYRAMWEAGVEALTNKLAGPADGGSTYSAQYRSSTMAWIHRHGYGYAPIYEPLQAIDAQNLPEPETTQEIQPTDPVYLPIGPEVPDA
jgi:hypothetical protein